MRVPRSHLAGTSSRESRIREGAEISADLYVQAGSSDPRGCRDLAWLVCPAGRFGSARVPRSRLVWECKGLAQRRTCEVAVGAGGFGFAQGGLRVPRSHLAGTSSRESRIREGAEISADLYVQAGSSDPRGCRDLAWLVCPAGRFGPARMPRFRLAWECKGRAQRMTCEVARGTGGFLRVPRSRSAGWQYQQGESDP